MYVVPMIRGQKGNHCKELLSRKSLTRVNMLQFAFLVFRSDGPSLKKMNPGQA